RREFAPGAWTPAPRRSLLQAEQAAALHASYVHGRHIPYSQPSHVAGTVALRVLALAYPNATDSATSAGLRTASVRRRANHCGNTPSISRLRELSSALIPRP